MAYYPQQNQRKLTLGADGNALVMLMAVLLTVFVLLSFIKVIYLFSYGKEWELLYNDQILQWVMLPADPGRLLTRPWTIITHFLAHDEVWHLISNLLWLWGFGYILQDLTGNRKLIPIFIYGSLAGALAYLLAYNFIPGLKTDLALSRAIGASAGIMAIAIATTVMAPGYRIFPFLNGGIPLWVLTMIFVIIDLATIPYKNAGGHIAHIAGAAMGYLFMVQMKKGRDWSDWMNNVWEWWVNLFNPDKPKKGRVIKSDVFYKQTVPPYQKKTSLTQQRIDEILEKIHQKGYQSLTEEEKALLQSASKDDKL